jgi:hypothetical protein
LEEEEEEEGEELQVSRYHPVGRELVEIYLAEELVMGQAAAVSRSKGSRSR